MLKIEKVKPLNDYSLEVTFENNETKICNIRELLNKGDFTELKDEHLFKRVQNTKYSIEWPNNLDLSSDTLYIIGKSA